MTEVISDEEATERLAVLGQINVVRARLDTLEQQLTKTRTNYTKLADAEGNVTYQTGVLVGRITRFQDAMRRRQAAPDKP